MQLRCESFAIKPPRFNINRSLIAGEVTFLSDVRRGGDINFVASCLTNAREGITRARGRHQEWGSDYRKSYKLTTTHVWRAKHAQKEDTKEDEFEALSAWCSSSLPPSLPPPSIRGQHIDPVLRNRARCLAVPRRPLEKCRICMPACMPGYFVIIGEGSCE